MSVFSDKSTPCVLVLPPRARDFRRRTPLCCISYRDAAQRRASPLHGSSKYGHGVYDVFALFATFFLDADKTDTCRRPASYPHRLLKTLWTTARDFARDRAIPLMLNDMGTRRCHLLAKEALALFSMRGDFFCETFDERCEWE